MVNLSGRLNGVTGALIEPIYSTAPATDPFLGIRSVPPRTRDANSVSLAMACTRAVNSGHSGVSVARMVSPQGWQEPGQRPEFDEITVVLQGMIRVEYEGGTIDVQAGQAIVTSAGEWVRYSTPDPGGAEYIAVCTPAFSPATVHRDA